MQVGRSNVRAWRSDRRRAFPADMNGDGFVNSADQREFLRLLLAKDPIADFTGDGVVSFTDYLEFLNRYMRNAR